MSMGSAPLVQLYISVSLILLAQICIAADMLYSSQTMGDGETLVSAGEKFRLGFFSPGKSKNRYLGIWYNNIPSQNTVWVANRDFPLNDSSGILKMRNDGNLVLLDHMERVVWSSNVQNLSAKSKIAAQLLDSGNFVLRDESSSGELESYLWQSFNQRPDTMLAGMKLGWDLRTGLNQNLTSWLSADDPSPGNFTYGVDFHGLPQLILRKGSIKQFRTGPWDGVRFSGIVMKNNTIFHSRIISTPESLYTTCDVDDKSIITSAVLNYSGMLQRKVWSNKTLEWNVMHTLPSDSCDNYGHCGPNGICTISDDRICDCLTGYTPISPQDWDLLIWSGGCIRKNPLNCPRGEGFIELKSVKMPDLLQFWVNTSMTLVECEAECLKNCSCTTYTYTEGTSTGSGCLLWFGDLIDVRKIAEYGNETLFFRVTASDLAANARKTLNGSPGKKNMLVISMVSAVLGALMLISCYYYQWRRHAKKKANKKNKKRREMFFLQSAKSLSDHKDTFSSSRAEENKNVELAFFGLETVIAATNNFSPAKMLGRGGFGTVYKGQLSNGQEIAVKRLSKKSRQGIVEFKNEVLLIAKLQHRNLVRLLGCCIEDEEKMLIYEYMPNRSLDYFIVDQSRKLLLDWKKRFDIIMGIARGILYLHQDSRLRIIHRDLKTSNVLLDAEMKPKISDFGLARMFKGDQIQEKTNRVVGTYGYMSPEYAVFGKYSIKSDVFSFGIILLEIVSGKKINDSSPEDSSPNLIGSVWELWGEDKALGTVDPSLESFPSNEVLRCIQVGLLCVQEDAADRPTMSTVVLMLNSETTTLPSPKQPAFVFRKNCSDPVSLKSRARCCSVNEVTITMEFEAR